MARERWPVLSPGGGEVLPVTDGVYYTKTGMGASTADNCQVYVELFYDAAGTLLASPTAGTIRPEGSPMGQAWLAPSSGEVINAADVKSFSTYTPSVFFGRMEQGRVKLAGVTGAVTARITFWRF